VAYPSVSDGASSSLAQSEPAAHSPEDLVTTHRYLCVRAARRFLRPGLERSDLEQVAALGLIKASRRFDATTRTPFEAYAWINVLGELMHFVRDHESAVRLPRALHEFERRINRMCERYVAQFGSEPSHAEVARSLAIPRSSVEQIRAGRSAARIVSLDALPPAHAGSAPIDPEDLLLIEDSFKRLDVLQKRVVGGVYFLGMTQAQLARSLQLSPKRVSRIHLGALASMRRAWA
jgi:RNA polymerase sigma-B factor